MVEIIERGAVMRCKGYVKWYHIDKGFGFANTTIDGEEIDVFIHFSEIKNGMNYKLDEGDYIEFNIEEFKSGFKAINILVIG